MMHTKYSHLYVITHTKYCPSGPPREFLGPRAKGNLDPSSNSPNNDTQTKSTTCVISKESVQQKGIDEL